MKFKHNRNELSRFHPSGDPQPSREDVELLKKFKEAGEILGISILDQIIIGGNNEFYSFTTQSKIT